MCVQLCVLHVWRQLVRFGPLPPPGRTWQFNLGHQVWPWVALHTSHFIGPNKNLFYFWFQRLQSITGGPDMVEQLTSWWPDSRQRNKKKEEQAIALKIHKWPSSFSQHRHARIPPLRSSSFQFCVYQWMKTFTESSWFNQSWKCLQVSTSMLYHLPRLFSVQ